ncbi:hypothetical protein [Mahella australiensis]|uniref:Uncharacterized protein n=1 Tax=Mahella australiensis (strain DSM 15567 / CIP 107919 / 50-1 BON) TaxID=697281 RepID=F3ZVF7_MAHA5|nr:hypothetical protein [Mahella australiensis]AEE95307.1 hypothetical protein Mahau_0084 [Mahella australiensis 50-1 BON]
MKSQEEIAISRSKKDYNEAVKSVCCGMTVKFKPTWAGRNVENIQYRQGKVVAKYEHHFRVRLGKVYECFKYTDVMLGEVQVMNR